MSVTREFSEAVESGNLLRVRIMLKDSLIIDPTSNKYNEMINYAKNRIDGIYDEHDKETLNYDKSQWNIDYLNRQMVSVVDNFSRERIELLKSMVRVLYKEKIRESNTSNSSNIGKSERKTKVVVTRKQVGTGVAVAGAAITVAGICTSQAIITIGGVVITVGGVALIVSDKGNR